MDENWFARNLFLFWLGTVINSADSHFFHNINDTNINIALRCCILNFKIINPCLSISFRRSDSVCYLLASGKSILHPILKGFQVSSVHYLIFLSCLSICKLSKIPFFIHSSNIFNIPASSVVKRFIGCDSHRWSLSFGIT